MTKPTEPQGETFPIPLTVFGATPPAVGDSISIVSVDADNAMASYTPEAEDEGGSDAMADQIGQPQEA